MPKLTKSQLSEALVKKLHLAEPIFRLQRAGDRMSGSIVSSTFVGKPDHMRQQIIWDALDDLYGMESVRLVGMLLAYTPLEWDASADAKSSV